MESLDGRLPDHRCRHRRLRYLVSRSNAGAQYADEIGPLDVVKQLRIWE
jgi:hypothetical protein